MPDAPFYWFLPHWRRQSLLDLDMSPDVLTANVFSVLDSLTGDRASLSAILDHLDHAKYTPPSAPSSSLEEHAVKPCRRFVGTQDDGFWAEWRREE